MSDLIDQFLIDLELFDCDELMSESCASSPVTLCDSIPSCLQRLEDRQPVFSECEDGTSLPVESVVVGQSSSSTDLAEFAPVAGVKRVRSEDNEACVREGTGAVSSSVGHSSSDYADIGDVVPSGNAGNFRLRGKSFHLTYRGHIGREQLFPVVGGESGLDYWSIVWELGTHSADSEQPYAHTHFFFRTRVRLDRHTARTFDIDDVHPHIQRVSNIEHEGRIFHQYHRKDPIQLWQSEAAPPDPTLARDKKRVRELIQRGSLLDACFALGVEISTVSDIRAIREERVPPPPEESEFTEDDFSLKLNWMSSHNGMLKEVDSMLLYGPSGMGKTERALTMFKRPLLVRSLDSARDYHPDRYDGIVFDDVSLSHLSPEEKIHLLDGDHIGSVRCRYANGTLPKHTKRIFTTNRAPNDFFTGGATIDPEQLVAFKRRIKIYHVSSPTFKT